VNQYSTVEQAADDNKAHANYMLYKVTNTYSEYLIGPTYCFATVTKVARTHLSVM
jgi:hypothetical protein